MKVSMVVPFGNSILFEVRRSHSLRMNKEGLMMSIHRNLLGSFVFCGARKAHSERVNTVNGGQRTAWRFSYILGTYGGGKVGVGPLFCS